jgi:hypothetical protein
LTRPTRIVTLDNGDQVTETATSGKFTVSLTNTSFSHSAGNGLDLTA